MKQKGNQYVGRTDGGAEGREGKGCSQSKQAWKMVQGLSWSGATTYGAAAAAARLGWD